MAITESLSLLITADGQGAVRSIQQVGRTADRELSRSERQLDRWGHRLSSVGAGMVAFGAVAAAGLHEAAQSAGELEQAVGGTEAVFGDARSTIDEYAEHAAKSVGLSKTAFRDLTTVAGAQLKNLGFDVDEAAAKSIQLTEIGADLAATYGGTTAEAVEALGAAFRGEADPAERFGLRLNVNTANAKAVALGLASSTAAVDDHARAQAILALIMEQGADAMGQWDDEADTLTHQQQVLAAQFEDMKADIGAGVIPVMKTLTDVAGDVVGGLSSINEATGGTLGQLATMATVASLGVGGLSLLAGQAIKMRTNLSAGKDAVVALTGRLGGLKGAAAAAAGVAGIAGLAIAVVQLGDMLDKALTPTDVADLNKLENALLDLGRAGVTSGELAAVAGDDMGKLADAVRRVADPSVASRARDALTSFTSLGGDNDDLEQARQDIDDVDQALSRLAERDPEEAAAAFDALTGALAEQGISASTVKALLDEYDSTLAGIDTAEATSGTEDLGGAMDGAAGATEDAKSALESYNDALKGLFDPLYGAIDAANGLRDANQEVAEKTAELTAAEAEFGVGSAEATAAAQALSDAQFGASEAALDQEMALRALKQSVDEHPGALDAAKAKLAEWVAQGGITQASADATARELDALAWAAGGVKEDVNIDVSASGVQYVIGQLDDLARAINRSSGGNIRVSVGGGGGLILHEGGYVPGPRGQEVAAILQAGERVLSLDEVDAMSRGIPAPGVAASGGVGPTVIVQIDRPIVASEHEFRRMVTNAVAQGARIGDLHLRVGSSGRVTTHG